MRAHIAIFSASLLLIALACSLSEAVFTPPATSPPATPLPIEPATPTPVGESQAFHLEYPEGWKPVYEIFGLTPEPSYNQEFQAQEALSVGRKDMSAYCNVLVKDLAAGESLESAMRTAYQVLDNYPNSQISQATIQVNNLEAVEKVYRRPHGEPWYQVRDVWFQQGNRLIVLSCWAHPEDYQAALPEFEAILQSMRFP